MQGHSIISFSLFSWIGQCDRYVLLVLSVISIAGYTADSNEAPLELLGDWRITGIHSEQTYTELSDCGLAQVSIRSDRANEYYDEYGFLFKACISNEMHIQCFTSPEPGVLTGISAGFSCAIVTAESCYSFLEPDEVQWQCQHYNLSRSECVALETQYRKTNSCIAERQSLENQHSLFIPEAITGYKFVDDKLVLYGSTGEKLLLQRHKWLPGIEEKESASD